MGYRLGSKLAAVVVTALMTTACAQVDLPPLVDTTGASILWVPTDAILTEDGARPVVVKNGRSIYVDRSSAVGFSLVGDREELSAEVVRYFMTVGWHRRDTQYLDPEYASSVGWQSRCACVLSTDSEGKVVPREPYYQWYGEWENDGGEVVTYRLSAEGRQLGGYATFAPSSVPPAVVSKPPPIGSPGR